MYLVEAQILKQQNHKPTMHMLEIDIFKLLFKNINLTIFREN